MFVFSACPKDYRFLVKDSKYCFKKGNKEHEILSFAESRKICKESNGDLATIHNVEERNYFLTVAYRGYTFGYTRSEGSKCIL